MGNKVANERVLVVSSLHAPPLAVGRVVVCRPDAFITHSLTCNIVRLSKSVFYMNFVISLDTYTCGDGDWALGGNITPWTNFYHKFNNL